MQQCNQYLSGQFVSISKPLFTQKQISALMPRRLSLRLRSMDLIKSYGGIKLYTYVSELEKHLEVLTVQRSEAY